MDREKVGEIIKTGREKRGLTQAELGKLLGKSREIVNLWESGKSFPKGEILLRLLEELDIVSDLFPGYVKVIENKDGASSPGKAREYPTYYSIENGVAIQVKEEDLDAPDHELREKFDALVKMIAPALDPETQRKLEKLVKS